METASFVGNCRLLPRRIELLTAGTAPRNATSSYPFVAVDSLAITYHDDAKRRSRTVVHG